MALNNEDWLLVRQGETEYKVQVGALSSLFSTSTEHADVLQQLGELQKEFDEVIIAAQEGADNIQIELQSYSKKDHSHDYLPLSGGELTNTLTGKLVKSIRNTGYAFEAKPDNVTTTASIHTDGSAKFSGNVKVDGTDLAKVDHTHSGYAASDHAHHWSQITSKPNTYPPSGHSHDGYASSSHSHSEMAILKKGTSTNPSLSQGEMYLNTSQKILYIGV